MLHTLTLRDPRRVEQRNIARIAPMLNGVDAIRNRGFREAYDRPQICLTANNLGGVRFQ
jgi:hypothetical protein